MVTLSELRGIGPKTCEKLQQLGINSATDLLFHLPRRYEDRTRLNTIADLRPDQMAQLVGRVTDVKIIPAKKRMLVCTLTDETGATILLRFFNFYGAQLQRFRSEPHIQCFGEVRLGRQGLELIHPEYHCLQEGESPQLAKSLTPVYPTVQGLTQKTLRRCMQQCLASDELVPELLPESCLKQFNLPTIYQALCLAHAPSPELQLHDIEQGTHPLLQRIVLEELLAHYLCLQQLRRHMKAQAAFSLENEGHLLAQLRAILPYQLTTAQQRVFVDIQKDLVQSSPMLRLVQGDVGSGKTVVALQAMLQAVESGYQALLMAPTELLAEQHYLNFCAMLQTLPVKVAYLVGNMPAAQRRDMLEGMASGEYDLIIGTHALFQDDVSFHGLALVVIDEQHRFGVEQRLRLKQKASGTGKEPHQLIMTATPIPRTLALAAYADLDCSQIDELPPGRQAVQTVMIDNARRFEVIERVRGICQQGQQAYWVCTLIDESELLRCEAAQNTATFLQQQLSELRVALVHGRMSSAEKQRVMQEFKQGEYQLLVATTVIEVGIDVPNATLMIIENSERLGLAQLHQLRGRVGRGSISSFCVLLYQKPLSLQANQRLQWLKQSNDGFALAEADLSMRGPGEVLGTRQSGVAMFRVADLMRDQHLYEQVHLIADELFKVSSGSAQKLIERWLKKPIEAVQV